MESNASRAHTHRSPFQAQRMRVRRRRCAPYRHRQPAWPAPAQSPTAPTPPRMMNSHIYQSINLSIHRSRPSADLGCFAVVPGREGTKVLTLRDV